MVSFFFSCTTEHIWSSLYTATQSCLTLCDPMDCSPPHSTVHGIFQAIFQEWVVVHLLSYDQLFETPCTTVCQAFLFFTLSEVCSNSCPMSRWFYLTISSSAAPFSFCLQFVQQQGPFQWDGTSYQVDQVLELQLQHQPLQWIFRVDIL